MAAAFLESAHAAKRIERAAEWLIAHGKYCDGVVVGASSDSAADLLRIVASAQEAVFGWHRMTLGRLAAELAGAELARLGLAPVSASTLEAVCARIVHDLGGRGALGRYQSVADRPGLPAALSRTLAELRLARAEAGTVRETSPELGTLLAAYEAELDGDGLADRALVMRIATEAARSGRHRLVGRPLLLFDVSVHTRLETDLISALAARTPDLFATVAAGDDRTMRALEEALGVGARVLRGASETGGLAKLQENMFEHVTPTPGELDEQVRILSAKGESHECVEIARLALRYAEQGVPFDRMAVLLRAPVQYRAHVEDAFRRAAIPAHFAQGTLRPDPAGRALLSLLACAAEGLSARRFAEYLSQGEVPSPSDDGSPPAGLAAVDRWVPPDEEMLADAAVRTYDGRAEPSDSEEADCGSLSAPHRWERLLVAAAVMRGRSRWERRLGGLERELQLDLQAAARDDPARTRIAKALEDLEHLKRFALPLIAEIESLPDRASWGDWIERLSALASRALRHRERVFAALAELRPMARVGPVDLAEVRFVLGRRIGEELIMPMGHRTGHLLIANMDAARGQSFDVVFVPGLSERIFPRKVTEDPILPDAAASKLDLPTSEDRIAAERLALRIAVGAARRAVVLSYPRIDLESSRSQVPSFYALEILRAALGHLPDWAEIARLADGAPDTRVGWPSPRRPEDAIDEAEYDLSVLRELVAKPESEAVGAARYLLAASPHLARALRFRARRWLRRWTPADGIVEPSAAAREALSAHALNARSYSPTALQKLAACPYQFLLYGIHKLAVREVPQAIEELNPLQRGSLVHEVLYELFVELREGSRLPVTQASLPDAQDRLERILDAVAAKYHDDLAPAIECVWIDDVAAIRADLREWLRRAALDDSGWVPWKFELSFGLGERRASDPDSQKVPISLDCGLVVRGSIDLVERDRRGALRVTDYKTGKVRIERGSIIGGGESLQPVLYSLVLERLFPGQPVRAGRLYYCTSTGSFEDRVVPLDDRAREAAKLLGDTVRDALERPFLPAAPSEGACTYCDYRPVCGPNEELRTRAKPTTLLQPLRKLRASS